MDLVILLLITFFVVTLCDKNNSPNFLSKILYNNEFKDEKEEKSFKKKNKKSSNKSINTDDELSKNLDSSADEELLDFNPSLEADSLISEIKGI